MTDIQLWTQALAELKMQMTRATYEHWFNRTTAKYDKGTDTLVITTRIDYIADWLTEKWTKPVKRLISGILGRDINIRFEGGR